MASGLKNSSCYQFMSKESGRLCHLIARLTGKLKFSELVQARIDLLEEHHQYMRNIRDRERAQRTIAYQQQLLVNPEQVFFRFRQKKRANTQGPVR